MTTPCDEYQSTPRYGRRSFVGFAASLFAGVALAAPQDVIIDTDAGTDDAIAIVLALNSPELVVRALTVVPGNVSAIQALDNTRRIAGLANRCDIPIIAGALRPLAGVLTTDEQWHGDNGLGGIALPAPGCPIAPGFAPDRIVEAIRARPHQITLITLGPLTNIALALHRDPGIAALVRRVIIMGGSLAGGNVTGAAEFNVYTDPEAAQLVFGAGWPITMVGLDVCNKVILTREHLTQIATAGGAQAKFVSSLGRYLLGKAAAMGDAGTEMYDPLAVAVAIDPSIVGNTAYRVDVETAGELTRGETVANRAGYTERRERKHFAEGDRFVITGYDKTTPNTDVAMSVTAQRFFELLLPRIAHAR